MALSRIEEFSKGMESASVCVHLGTHVHAVRKACMESAPASLHHQEIGSNLMLLHSSSQDRQISMINLKARNFHMVYNVMAEVQLFDTMGSDE